MPLGLSPAQLVAGCILVRIEGHDLQGGAKCLNVINAQSAAPDPTDLEVENVATAVAEWCNMLYGQDIAETARIDRVVAQTRAALTGPMSVVVVGRTGDGETDTAAIQDPAWAPLILMNTGLIGRSHHGRFYAFQPANKDVTGGLRQYYSQSHLDNLVDRLGLLKTALADLGNPLVVASATYNTTTLVNGFTASGKLTLQTRRREGFGDW